MDSLSSDGQQILDAKVLDPWEKDKNLHLSPESRFWIIEDDFDYYRWIKNKLWIREQSQQKDNPLIDQTIDKES